MEYPGSKITRPIRVTILISFIVIFFILSPIIILYTAGYRYDFQHGLLKETGSVSIDILPATAVVYLNDLKLKKKMPIRLNNLTPGKYRLKITAPGFFDWVKEIEVKNKQTVYIKEIIMLKKNEPRIILKKNIDVFGLSPDGRYILYSFINKKVTEVWIKDLGQQKDFLSLVFPRIKKIKITWAKKHDYAIVSDAEAPYENIFIIDPLNPEKEFELTKKINPPIKKIQWSNSAEPLLILSAEKKLMSISPVSGQSQIISREDYPDWRMEDDKLWTLVYSEDRKNIKIVKDTLGFTSEFGTVENTGSADSQETVWQLLTAKDDNVLLKKKDRPEMLLLASEKKFSLNGEKFLISDYNNWWLIWTPWELWTYSSGEEPYLLNRSGEQLEEVLPLDQYNTLALIWLKKISSVFPYYLVSHDLLEFTAKNAAADTAKRIMYFKAEIDGQTGLWKLEY